MKATRSIATHSLTQPLGASSSVRPTPMHSKAGKRVLDMITNQTKSKARAASLLLAGLLSLASVSAFAEGKVELIDQGFNPASRSIWHSSSTETLPNLGAKDTGGMMHST